MPTIFKYYIKKIIFILIISVMIILFNLTTLAKSGDVIGNIYSTNILAFINDIPVQSYNINGKTAIILEDLQDYGIYCSYSNELRTLVAYSRIHWIVPDSSAQNQAARGKVGGIAGNIYETDIVTYVNGLPINAFVINGKIAVAIEDLGKITDGSEWSPYNMRCVWDAKKRTISLFFIYNNDPEVCDIIGDKPLKILTLNDELGIKVDHFMTGIGWSGNGNIYLPRLYPVYHNGQKVGMAFSRPEVHISYKLDGEIKLEEDGYDGGICYDLAAIRKLIDEIEITPPTYEEVFEYYTKIIDTRVIDSIDTDDYTFLYLNTPDPHGGSHILVRIGKDGNYIEYSREFQTVNNSGNDNKYFDFVTIDKETETVTFRYDTYYIIDLKTGKMNKK